MKTCKLLKLQLHFLASTTLYEPAQEILTIVAVASDNGSAKPVHLCSLVRAFAAHILKVEKLRKVQIKY